MSRLAKNAMSDMYILNLTQTCLLIVLELVVWDCVGAMVTTGGEVKDSNSLPVC